MMALDEKSVPHNSSCMGHEYLCQISHVNLMVALDEKSSIKKYCRIHALGNMTVCTKT